MFEAPVAHLKGLRQAMCLECGAVRSAKAQYLGRGTRVLRCEPCGHTTTHAAVNWDGEDPREQQNSERTLANAAVVREFGALMGLFRSSNIDVLIEEADQVNPDAQPLGGLVDVVRWLEPEGYLVRVDQSLSLADRVHCLDWAWRSMRPAVARWDRCTIETDPDGQLFQRIYNNELENGIFKPS